MPDFTLEPDEIEPERSSRPVRLVTTGLAPTAEVPVHGRKGYDAVPCYLPCSLCSALVLCGATGAGQWLALDTGKPTYAVPWTPGTAQPRLHASRADPVHACARGA
jgi:hypothetical protein